MLTVIDFFPVWYSAHRTLGASLMKHRPTVAYFSPADSGEIWLVKRGRQQGRMSTTENFFGPNYLYWKSVNSENKPEGVFNSDILHYILYRSPESEACNLHYLISVLKTLQYCKQIDFIAKKKQSLPCKPQ